MKDQLVREASGVKALQCSVQEESSSGVREGLIESCGIACEVWYRWQVEHNAVAEEFAILHHKEKALVGRPKDKLKQRIKELEKQLEDDKFKVLAYETLIEIVKQEDGIDVLKKGGAKRSVSLPRPGPAKRAVAMHCLA